MKIATIAAALEQIAPLSLQENYDNAGLLTGNAAWECSGIMICLDATEQVIQEAIQQKCNLLVSHHPIIFGGLKKITGKNYVEQTIIAAIKNDMAIYAIHTNLDNILSGVNGKMADMLELINRRILQPKEGLLKKLIVFVPKASLETVRSALFEKGAGHIGHYSECSFSTEGTGTFMADSFANPFVGKAGERHYENEIKLEMVFPNWLQPALIKAVEETHPYEVPAVDIFSMENKFEQFGSGLIAETQEPISEIAFLRLIKEKFNLQTLRHTPFTNRLIQKVALCGGAGSFLIKKALSHSADIYITADVKYHEFFDADGKMLIADIGHYESEQFTIDLLFDILKQKFPTFAVLKTTVKTNPVSYF